MSANSEQLPPPKSDADFESLCLDLFRAVWGDPGAQKNGRSGQPQAGVDVFGKYQGRQVGVQCKQTEQRRLPASMLVEEVGKARGSATKPGFTPALSAFVLATTAPRDAELQKKARELSTDDFEVSVWSWDDIVEELFHRRTLLRDIFPIYWPTIARLGPSVEEVLDLLLKRLETLNTKPVAQPRGAPAPATAPQPTRPSAALEVWQKKLDYLLGQEPITVDPDAKFRLAALIEEARQKIREHRGSA